MSTVWQSSMQVPGSSRDEELTPGDAPKIGAACVPNINSQERRKRLIAGIIQFAIAFIMLAVLIATGVDRWWRLPLLLLLAVRRATFNGETKPE